MQQLAEQPPTPEQALERARVALGLPPAQDPFDEFDNELEAMN